MLLRLSRYFLFFLVGAGFWFCAEDAFQAQDSNASVRTLAVVKDVAVSPQVDRIEIQIVVSPPLTPQGVRLTSPDRLVFDFPGYVLSGLSRRIAVDHGPVRAVRVSLFQSDPPITRVVVDSKEAVNFEVKTEKNGILIQIPFSESDSAPAEKIHPAKPENLGATAVEQSQLPQEKLPMRPLSRVTAYSLQARAKDLKLHDLQPLEEKAQAGDAEAETTLALAYHDAILLKKDDMEALRLLHKAADQGFMAAEESLGIFSQTGIGTSRPAPEEALDWYKKAVALGSLDAATNIALMYEDGTIVPQDSAQAILWFRRAADGGDGTAQYNLALIYAQGKGTQRDYKESVHWLTLAAEQNVVPAILDLAHFYLQPPDGEKSDLDQAIHYYEKAADLGNVNAEAILGNIFASSARGKPEYDQAAMWYKKAADHGQPDAEFGLGVRYELGQGVPLNLQEARHWFSAAADQGLPDAQFELGAMWEEGKGDSVDLAMAKHYFALAAEQGNTKAQLRLGKLLVSDDRSRSDRISAYKWLMLAQSLPESAAVLASLRKSMSSEEVAEAERAVDDWRISHQPAHR